MLPRGFIRFARATAEKSPAASAYQSPMAHPLRDISVDCKKPCSPEPWAETMTDTRTCDRSGGVTLLRLETSKMAHMRVAGLRRGNAGLLLICGCVPESHSSVREARARSVSFDKPLIDHVKVNDTSPGRSKIVMHQWKARAR